MENSGLDVFIPVLILILLGILIVVLASVVSYLIRPNHPTPLKKTPYECGESPSGQAWALFNVRFYVVGLIFIIFDVEAALIFPVAAVFRELNKLGLGGVVFVEVSIFILILFVAMVYCWSKGDLDWVKTYKVAKDGDRTTV